MVVTLYGQLYSRLLKSRLQCQVLLPKLMHRDDSTDCSHAVDWSALLLAIIGELGYRIYSQPKSIPPKLDGGFQSTVHVNMGS